MHGPAGDLSGSLSFGSVSNSEIDQLSNQSPISSWIIKCVTIIKSEVHIGFHYSASRFALQKSFLPEDSEHIFVGKEVHYIFDVQLQYPKSI